MGKIPEQKSLSPYVVRHVPRWYVPVLDGNTWRTVVRNVPFAGLSMQRIINHIRSLQWSITARVPAETKKYSMECKYYTNILNGTASQGFDQWIDKTLQDALTMPVGGAIEVVRYNKGAKVKYDGHTLAAHPQGHVAKIVHIDGATLYATGDDTYPLVQRYNGGRVTFPAVSVGRILVLPRPEIDKSGYGMPPPELVYLALRMVYSGDVYFSSMMSDAPEAGVLYLGNITQDDASVWLDGFRALFTGGSVMKIPVTYGETAPKYIPFTRSPSEVSFSETQIKYARLVAAAYGLRLSDLGVDGGEQTLAGKIRDQVAARLNGFGVAQTFVENLVNSSILPPYLKFGFVIKDPEQQIQVNRARLIAMQWAKTATDAGILSAEIIRKQMAEDGLFTVDIEAIEDGQQQGDNNNTTGGNENKQLTEGQSPDAAAKKEADKVSPEAGGRGDIKQEKSYAIPELSAVQKSIKLLADIGMDRGSAIKTLAMFSAPDSRQEIARAISKNGNGDSDPVGMVIRAMHNETKRMLRHDVTLYRRYYGKGERGSRVQVSVPSGDVWVNRRDVLRGRVLKATFSPDEVISVSTLGTGFGDPYRGEVLVVGGNIKDAEVI